MAHINPSADELQQLLTSAGTLAIVGASSNPARPSYQVMSRLLAAGYRIFPVNPNETSVLGQAAAATLDAVPQNVDIVVVFRRAEDTPPIAGDAVRIGAKALWLQSGIYNEDAAATAMAGGLTVVMDRCMAVDHARFRIPTKR
jgi:predicted CoA-binding protein